MDMPEFSLVEWVGLATALVPLIAAIWKYIARPVAKLIHAAYEVVISMLTLAKKAEKLDQSMELVAAIYNELKPNGGASLRDSLDRIETRQVVTEERLRVMSMDTEDGIFESDSTGQFVFVNRTLQRMVKMNHSDLNGNGWVNAVCVEERAEVYDAWMDAIEQKREFVYDFNMITTDGLIIPVHANAVPIYDHKRKMVGFVGKIVILPTVDNITKKELTT